MKCRDIELLSIEYFSNRLDPERKKEVEAHLSVCGACRRTVNMTKDAWTKLDKLPLAKPSPALRARFDAMLSAEKRNIAGEQIGRGIKPKFRLPGWLPARPAFGFALSFVLVVLGFLVGFAVRSAISGNGDVSNLRSEITEMRQMLTLSLLNQTSSVERLRGVQWSRQTQKPDKPVLDALLNTLDSDPSTNVRLAAVDALYLFKDRPFVRDVLVRSLERQKSPLVQIQIIDLLVEIREQKALNALRFLIQNDKTNPSVKEHAEWGIKQLI
jgi:anti-sigma factor RsiW